MKRTYSSELLSSVLAVVSLTLVANPLLIHAQQTASESSSANASLAFEVATIKPDDPKTSPGMELRVYPGGRLVIYAHNLRGLVSEAFYSPGRKVIGGEKWVDERMFDIVGKPPDELRNSVLVGEYAWFGIQDAKERAMLQALLIERFHLKYHIEKQPGTVYLLKRSSGPLRLQPVEGNLYMRSEDGSIKPSNSSVTGEIHVVSGAKLGFYKTSMLQLANILTGYEQAPVTDDTGLQGFYNYDSPTVVTEEDFKSGGTAHLLPEALPEMGLKLEKTQGMVEKLVIDHAELPTEN